MFRRSSLILHERVIHANDQPPYAHKGMEVRVTECSLDGLIHSPSNEHRIGRRTCAQRGWVRLHMRVEAGRVLVLVLPVQGLTGTPSRERTNGWFMFSARQNGE